MAPIDSTNELTSIPLCVPEIRGNEWEYVKECLDTNWVSSAGAFVERFEARLKAHTGTAHAVACVNGTSAIHLALMAAGVSEGDEVLVSTLTFIAPANAVRYTGAHPVFVDAHPDSWQMDPSLVREFLNGCIRKRNGDLINPSSGRRVAAILPVHILGHPADLDTLVGLADEYDLNLIEDASESIGARYRGEPVGRFGTVGCFSFNGNKMLTTGGGGMLVTDDPSLAEYARYLSTQAKDDPTAYIHEEVGYNYRLTNIQAAMGCAQLESLDEYVAKKRAIAKRYEDAFGSIDGLELMPEQGDVFHDRWLSAVEIDPQEVGIDTHTLSNRFAEASVQTRPLWQPMHESPAHEGAMFLGGDVAKSLHARVLCLPSSVGLSESDQQRVVNVILENIESD